MILYRLSVIGSTSFPSNNEHEQAVMWRGVRITNQAISQLVRCWLLVSGPRPLLISKLTSLLKHRLTWLSILGSTNLYMCKFWFCLTTKLWVCIDIYLYSANYMVGCCLDRSYLTTRGSARRVTTFPLCHMAKGAEKHRSYQFISGVDFYIPSAYLMLSKLILDALTYIKSNLSGLSTMVRRRVQWSVFTISRDLA